MIIDAYNRKVSDETEGSIELYVRTTEEQRIFKSGHHVTYRTGKPSTKN